MGKSKISKYKNYYSNVKLFSNLPPFSDKGFFTVLLYLRVSLLSENLQFAFLAREREVS
jgi:hypothetical protein